AYRIQKYVRRHRVGVLVAMAVLLLLVSFTALMGVQRGRIAVERDRANAERDRANSERDRASVEGARKARVIDFMTGMFSFSPSGEATENDVKAREVLDHASRELGEPMTRDAELHAELTAAIANAYKNLGLHRKAGA